MIDSTPARLTLRRRATKTGLTGKHRFCYDVPHLYCDSRTDASVAATVWAGRLS